MKQLILLLVVAVALVDYSQAQGNRKCAANGEYCLTHSECCSGSCLSFSYKCVPVPPSASVGTVFVPAPIETDNRFGGGDDSGTSITQKTCAKNGEYCLTHAECCSGSCLSFSYKCVPTQPGTSSVQQQPQQPVRPQAFPTTIRTTTVDLGNRIGEEGQSSSTTTAATTARPQKCAAVGEYCLTAADCCSRSCLSFSYKCVQNYDLGTQQLTSSGIPVQLPVGGSSINTIDTANRFGGGGSERQCLANGHACFYGQECCSGACFRSFCATQIHLGIPESALTRPSAVNGPFVQVNSLDELITRFGGGSDANHARDSSASASLKRANIGARSGVEKQCAVVGEGCSRQEDCCSMRCHSYRRKCVT
ncbi:AAEL007834-PB [Aedes aegypti]|uniref:AAEL007834-PB n=1 Tax=Aedes aegypti TaxID=7159 RepID=J9EA56_AEDAE|nr:AAEL007834-PB [Aedes aegypti]